MKQCSHIPIFYNMCANYFMETILSVLTNNFLTYSSMIVNTAKYIYSILYKSG